MLKFLSIRSFRMKLLLIIWISSTATLFLACGCFIFFEVVQFDKNLTKEIKILSNFIAEKSTQAIMFNDPAIAQDALLSAASIEPSVVNAVIYDTEVNVVATYERDILERKEFDIPEPQQNTAFLKDAHLHLFSDIDMYSDRVGTVYIKADRHILYKRIQSYGIIVVGIMAVSLLFLVPISFILQKLISKPVMALISSAKQVSEKKDYAIRVKKQSDDELGILVDAFNEMLVQIQESDSALRESEARYKDLASFLPLSLFETDDQGNVTYANHFAFESTGYAQEDIDKGLQMLQVIHPKDHDRAKKMSLQVMQGELTDGSEYLVQGKDGSTFHAYINTNPTIRDDKLVGLKGYIFDLTGQKEAERALKESESKFRNLFDLSPQAVALTEVKSGRLVDINNKFCELTKYSKEEILGLNTTEVGFYLEADRRKFLKELQASGEVNGLEMEFKAKDNSFLHTLMFARIIQIEGESLILTIFYDLTVLKRLEAQLQQAHKMEAIGTLAGGIAHDFNNILSPIILHTELVLEDISEKDHLRFSLEEILRASLRAKDLTKQILTFSRQTEQERIPFKISPIVKEALNLLRSSLPSTIEIRQNIEAEVGVVLADPTQIHQILMNLGTNAAHSMRERGGVLEISLVDVALNSDDTDHAVDLEPGQYIKLTVSDTGHGIEYAIMDKIFDPYFTTQEKGKGTGLGLSVVHGIVNSYGGHISVHSEPDKGTRFDVYLPLFDLSDIKAETVSPEKLTIGNEHILLVDDEKPIVDVVQQMLERLGYQVTVRTSSIEALEVFRESMDKFDLVITDLTMPNMTGDKLAGELMNIRPDISIILCTGFSEKISKEKAEALGIKGFLMKPIVTSELAKLIREVIDKS